MTARSRRVSSRFLETTARHLLVELSGCDPKLLDDAQALRRLLCRAAETAGATVVAEVFHPFAPHGVTGVVVIEESHLSIHTWPEKRYAALDFYTCGDARPERAMEFLALELGAERADILEVARGVASADEPLCVTRRGPLALGTSLAVARDEREAVR